MVKTIYFYYLALDPMILQVIGAPCMDLGGGGSQLHLVSGVDHPGSDSVRLLTMTIQDNIRGISIVL
jgi:hypothetical protein